MSTALSPYRAHPDLAIIAPGERPPAELTAELTERAVPQLLVEVCEDRAVLGPLVIPGRTPCHRCRDLTLADRDPLWPRTLAALAGDGAAPRSACDTTLAALAANHAVLHALAFLDGQLPPSAGATCEFALPYAFAERLAFAAHPACGCMPQEPPASELRYTASAQRRGADELAEWTM